MRAIGVLLLVVLAGLGGWYGRARHDQAQARVQVAVAAELEKQVQEARQQAEDSDRAAAFNGEKVLAHEKTIRALQAKRDAVVIPPPSAPIEIHLTTTELRLALCEDEVKAREDQANAFRAHVDALVTSRDRYKAALDLSERRGDTLRTVSSITKWSVAVGPATDMSTGRVHPLVVVGRQWDRHLGTDFGHVNGNTFAVLRYSGGSQ